MEVYFKPNFDDTCNQATTSTVRNFLVEEDDAPFGFDIVTNQFRPSPFELFKDQCGTNIYEVQTEVSWSDWCISDYNHIHYEAYACPSHQIHRPHRAVINYPRLSLVLRSLHWSVDLTCPSPLVQAHRLVIAGPSSKHR